jgi:multidrug efflux pump subunit AcrA (membrane-fusion protein)
MPARLRQCLLLLLMCAPPGLPAWAQAPGGPPPSVGIARVEARPVTESSEFVGRVSAIGRVALTARVTAFLEERQFTEGAEVNEGDLLFRLDQAQFEAEARRQEAVLAEAQSRLANANIQLQRLQSLVGTPADKRASVDDAVASQRAAAHARRAVDEAWEVLSDPDRRAVYDRTRDEMAATDAASQQAPATARGAPKPRLTVSMPSSTVAIAAKRAAAAAAAATATATTSAAKPAVAHTAAPTRAALAARKTAAAAPSMNAAPRLRVRMPPGTYVQPQAWRGRSRDLTQAALTCTQAHTQPGHGPGPPLLAPIQGR